MLRRFLFSAILIAVAFSAAGRERELSRQESDSVSHALATLWGNYIKKKALADGDSVSAEYMRGVQEALKLSQGNDAYFQGLSEGVVMGRRIREVETLGSFKVDVEKLAYVLSRIEKGRPSGFSEETAEQYLNGLMSRIAVENRQIEGSEEYLREASQREGVIKTPSGLLFEVLTEGEGEKPGPKDQVLVKYTGRLIDGTVFNETPDDQDVFFHVNETIPGFAEGLQMMKKGGTYRIYIPSELGYGDKGVQGLIPGGAATIFDIRLLDFRRVDDDGNIIVPDQEKQNNQ